MKGKCPRCKSGELIYLFTQDRYDKGQTPLYRYTWTYYECCECSLVFIESKVHRDKYEPKILVDGEQS